MKRYGNPTEQYFEDGESRRARAHSLQPGFAKALNVIARDRLLLQRQCLRIMLERKFGMDSQDLCGLGLCLFLPAQFDVCLSQPQVGEQVVRLLLESFPVLNYGFFITPGSAVRSAQISQCRSGRKRVEPHRLLKKGDRFVEPARVEQGCILSHRR